MRALLFLLLTSCATVPEAHWADSESLDVVVVEAPRVPSASEKKATKIHQVLGHCLGAASTEAELDTCFSKAENACLWANQEPDCHGMSR